MKRTISKPAVANPADTLQQTIDRLTAGNELRVMVEASLRLKDARDALDREQRMLEAAELTDSQAAALPTNARSQAEHAFAFRFRKYMERQVAHSKASNAYEDATAALAATV
jgi:hypothetical protein